VPGRDQARRIGSRPASIIASNNSAGPGSCGAWRNIYFVLATALLAWLKVYPAAYLMLGILVGALSSGFGIARKSVKFWPINRQVIDWDKVEKMARGELLDASHSAWPNSTPVVS
jgi:hypothetical protein